MSLASRYREVLLLRIVVAKAELDRLDHALAQRAIAGLWFDKAAAKRGIDSLNRLLDRATQST